MFVGVNIALAASLFVLLFSRVSTDDDYIETDEEEEGEVSNSSYHNSSQLELVLRSLADNHPQQATLYSIGKSRKGMPLWVLELNGNLAEFNSSNPRLGVPQVKLVGNIHGNEPVGRELIIRLAKHLLENYTQDSEVRKLMDNTRISLLPCLNPDGFEKAVGKRRIEDCEHNSRDSGRTNAVGVDLNKNFPDYFRKNQFRIEPESEALKQWMSNNSFVLSASLHEGSQLVTYPYNSLESSHMWMYIINSTMNSINNNHSRPGGPRSPMGVINYLNEWHVRERQHRRNPTPDDDVFESLAKAYVKTNPNIREGCKNDFIKSKEGYVNGAEDQPSVGTMADYNYHVHSCMELTLKISCCTYPPASQLDRLWDENRQALLQFIGQAQRGVRGVVKNEDGEPIPFARVVVRGRDFYSNTTKHGEFWKLLTRSGLFTLQISADGYRTLDRYPFVVPEEDVASHPNYVWLNITLKRKTNDSNDSDQQDANESSLGEPPPIIDQNPVHLENWPPKFEPPANEASINSNTIEGESPTKTNNEPEEYTSGASTSENNYSRWTVFQNNYALIMIVIGMIALVIVGALICTEQFSARS